MNALEPISGAYRKARIVGANATPSADQGVWAIARLNKMMAALKEDGIDLGYSPVSSTTDTVTIPDGHQEAIEALLAVKLYTDFMGADVPAWLADEASGGKERLLRQAVLLQNTAVRMTHISAGAGGRPTYDIQTG